MEAKKKEISLRFDAKDYETICKEANQKITSFSVNEDKSFSLPEFEKLPKSITKVTNVLNILH